MSSKKFSCFMLLIAFAFFAAVTTGGCGGGDSDSGGGSLFSVNITQNNTMPPASDTQAVTNIYNNTYNNNVENNTTITNNVTTNTNIAILTVINIGNSPYDNTKDTDFNDISASEDAAPEIPDPTPLPDTVLSGTVYKAGTESSDGNVEEISGAVVSVVWGTESKDTTTGANGKFSFNFGNSDASIDYTLTVSADGYNLFTAEGEVAPHTQDDINVPMTVAARPSSGRIVARDAQSNEVVTGVTVRVFAGWDADEEAEEAIPSGLTASSGSSYSVENAGQYTVEFEKDNYITVRFNATFDEGSDNEITGYITRVMPEGQYRIVLTWGVYPTDLDAHLYAKKASKDIHVYYAHRLDTLSDAAEVSEAEMVSLDRDDVTSYGPETITFEVDENASYEYFIHWYSGASTYDWSRTLAEVQVFRGNDHLFTVTPPAETTGRYRYWRVFRIDNNNEPEALNVYSSAYEHIKAAH